MFVLPLQLVIHVSLNLPYKPNIQAHRQTSQAHEKLKQRTTACSPRDGIDAGTSVQSVDELASRSQANKAGCAQQKVRQSMAKIKHACAGHQSVGSIGIHLMF